MKKKKHRKETKTTSSLGTGAGPAEQLKGGSRSRSSISCWV